MMLERRKKLFVDYDIQKRLLRQLVFNWLVVFGVIAAVLLAVESYKANFTLGFYGSLLAIWEHNATLLLVLCFLAPFMIYESIKLSHQFVGPMVSFRRHLRRLGEGKIVGSIQFRKDDCWQDLPASFNLVVDRMNELEAAANNDQDASRAGQRELEESATRDEALLADCPT